jgi:ferredoxin hydrogenase large subunit
LNGFQENEITKGIEIDSNKCKGCDSCKVFCSMDAIGGKYGAVHRIDNEKCVFCGQCLSLFLHYSFMTLV